MNKIDQSILVQIIVGLTITVLLLAGLKKGLSARKKPGNCSGCGCSNKKRIEFKPIQRHTD